MTPHLHGILLASFLVGAADVAATPLRVVVVGDSLTEEYAFEVPFSAPDSNPAVANARNWPELLSAHRAADVTFGSYNSGYFTYPDLRNGGYKTNYGVPSFTTGDWLAVIQSSFLDTFSSDPVVAARYPTRIALERHLEDEADVVVIFLGGNDLKRNYTGVFHDANPPALLAQATANLTVLHDFIRAAAPSLPIIVATAPDIGATPEVASKYNDPARLVIARQRVAAMNAAIEAMATGRGATVARVDILTDMVFDDHPFHLNGTVFSMVPDPANPPHAAFCKDGFHPNTPAQALIADILIDALNRATGRAIPRLTNREILGTVLALNPDQPYLDWAGTAGGMNEDPDHDGLPNLTEFLLGTPPDSVSAPFTFTPGGTLRVPISQAALRFAAPAAEESPTLTNWQPVPTARILIQADGSWQIPPSSGRMFYRLSATPRP